MSDTQSVEVPQERIMAIDALRGFDMFWIIGGQGVVMTLLALLKVPRPEWFARQFDHMPWIGFSGWDLIMPLFLFITGASIPFAFSNRRRRHQSTASLYLRVFRRVVILFVFGMIVQGHILAFKLDQLHLYSNTLQAIAAGYLVASIAQLTLPVIGQLWLTAVLLVTYWALMMFVPFAGHPGGTLEGDANFALYVDHLILGHFEDGKTYTWVLSSLGFAGTVLLGSLGGHILRMEKRPVERVGYLLAAGIGCLLGGWLWSFHFPIIKHIWTSSMVLWSGGWCYLLLGVFYLVIDVWGLRRWAFPFVVIGMNAITAYMAWNVLPFGSVSQRLFRGLADHLGENGGNFLMATGTFALIWLLLFYLYRNKTFLKV